VEQGNSLYLDVENMTQEDVLEHRIMLNIKSIIRRANSLGKMPVLILGNESYGMPKNILLSRDKIELSYTLELHQMGSIRSFNVANCCSILCYKFMEAFDSLKD
jgi:tRNA G18 (ribose-2'-O)-methylase SpoU